ncbi:MAG: helix-turn-helix domain-containing protein, partial [Acidimicrobiales bacterium]
LVRLARRYGTRGDAGVEIVAPLSQRELAEWSGMSREAFVKALARLRALGWVSVEGHTIVLHDAAAVFRRGGFSDERSN